MATGSGLDAQLMFAPETTWATAVTPTKAVEFDSETLAYDPTFEEPTGLRPGILYKRASRVRVSRQSVSGDFTLEHATKNMGTLWKYALGSNLSAPVVIGATTAYKQIHTPQGQYGLGITVQVGRPEPSTGNVKPFTYSGCKISGWEFDVKDNATPTLKLTVDGQKEDTTVALATPSYIAGSTVFDFSQATMTLGGTAATASGETTISSGVAVSTIITEFTLTGSNPMATDRYGLGNAGLKAQQLQNDTPTITGKLSAEFNKAELYDVFKANTTTAMHFSLTGGLVASSPSNYLLDFVLPAIKIKSAPPNVSGPDIVQMSTTFEVYSDEVNPVIQVKIVSDEATL
jgi:Phage tail tube protein